MIWFFFLYTSLLSGPRWIIYCGKYPGAPKISVLFQIIAELMLTQVRSYKHHFEQIDSFVFPLQVLSSMAIRRASMPGPTPAQMTLYLQLNPPLRQHISIFTCIRRGYVFSSRPLFSWFIPSPDIGQSSLPLHLFQALLPPASQYLQLLIPDFSPYLRTMVRWPIISLKESLRLSPAPPFPSPQLHFVSKLLIWNPEPTSRVATRLVSLISRMPSELLT